MKTKLHFCYICEGGLGPDHAHFLVESSVSGNPQGSRLVDYVGLPVEFLSLSGPAILPPTLPSEFPIHCLTVGICIYLNQLLGGASQKTACSCLQA